MDLDLHLLSIAGNAVAVASQSEVDASVACDPVSPQSFLIYCINIRWLLSDFAELCHRVKVFSPHVDFFQETWLNKSIEEVQLPNYRIVSRRDRSEGENRGGIATYARLDIYNMVCVKISIESERVWHFLHLDVGTIAVCNW